MNPGTKPITSFSTGGNQKFSSPLLPSSLIIMNRGVIKLFISNYPLYTASIHPSFPCYPSCQSSIPVLCHAKQKHLRSDKIDARTRVFSFHFAPHKQVDELPPSIAQMIQRHR